jgi:hypothetical protein
VVRHTPLNFVAPPPSVTPGDISPARGERGTRHSAFLFSKETP